jgi:hypothetical protein
MGFCFLVIMAVEYYCLQYDGKETISLLSIYVFKVAVYKSR